MSPDSQMATGGNSMTSGEPDDVDEDEGDDAAVDGAQGDVGQGDSLEHEQFMPEGGVMSDSSMFMVTMANHRELGPKSG